MYVVGIERTSHRFSKHSEFTWFIQSCPHQTVIERSATPAVMFATTPQRNANNNNTN
jgi:hypothetical protein